MGSFWNKSVHTPRFNVKSAGFAFVFMGRRDLGGGGRILKGGLFF